jgi:hypothetical protein
VLEALYAEYRHGATIVLQALHERWPTLTILCRSLAWDLSAGVQVNAYLTPPNAQGLKPHYDTHDVFVLQAAGSKHWSLYDVPTPLPLRGQPFESNSMSPGQPSEEFDLHPGDLLYVPRGLVHSAVSDESASLHLTVGINTITWASAVLHAVESIIERDARFRESLPMGFAREEGLREQAEAQLARLLTDLGGQAEPASTIQQAVEEAWAGLQPDLHGHLLDLEVGSEIGSDTPLCRRAAVPCKLDVTSEHASLRFNGKMVQMPARVERELAFILRSQDFRAIDLPGELDEEGRLTLVRSLVREGLLTIRR